MNAQSSKREIFGQEMKKWWEENKDSWSTQKKLADHLDIGKSTIGDYIRGVSFPSPAIAEKLYEITQLDILKPGPKPEPQMHFLENASQNRVPAEEPGDAKEQSVKGNIKSKVPEEASIPDKDTQTEKPVEASPPSTTAERQEFFIPIFGFVWLFPEEVKVLDHPAVQRLGRINQLGLANLVYRGATHRRLEHSIGTVHIAQRIINALRHTADKARKRNQRCGAAIQTSEERFIRLGALLHDIGHVVSGHTIEDEMCLIYEHDSDERLDALFIDAEQAWVDKDNLTLGQLINREFQKYLPKDLVGKSIIPSDVIRLLIRKCPKEEKDNFLEKQKILEECTDIRLNICRDIIGNTICADLLDYLHRDWYHIGKVKTFDDRILQYMEVCPGEQPTSKQNPIPKNTDKFVINLGKSPKIRTDAVSQILGLLEWRYELTESVLFHRAKLAAEAMLNRALYELWGTDNESAERELLSIGDDELFRVCIELAEEKENSVSVKILRALEKRQLFTSLCTFSYYDLLRERQFMIQDYYSPGLEPSTIPATHRNQILQVLENDFALTPGSLAMFCPGGSMKAKVADVVITVGDSVEQFSKYEEQTEDSLSAGHLTAQIRRFERLWRVHFFIEEEEKKRMGPMIELLLQDAILKLALGVLQPYQEDSPEVIARTIATNLTTIESSPWYRHKMREEPIKAAYSDVEAATGMYPFGAPSIRSYIENEPPKSGS